MPAEPSFDLILRDTHVEGIHGRVDLAAKDGLIAAIGPAISGSADEEIDAGGAMASPPFIDPHTHLDKAYLQPVVNHSGTLQEAIAIMQSNKESILSAGFHERVDRALRAALQHGTLTVRTHVDVDVVTGTQSLEAMLRARERWAALVDIQIVAFPQDGLVGKPAVQEALRRSMALGADAIGGIPALEADTRAAREHIDFAFELAAEFDTDVDMHIDESDDPNARTLEMLAHATEMAGWQGRVAAAHCTALAAYDDLYAAQVIEQVVEARIHIITNPTCNLVLQGRQDRQPVRRGITRVKELLAAGVNVVCGQDNMRDVFYPFGQADMLEVAFVTALAAQLTGKEEIQTAFDMVRGRAAKLVGLTTYGLREGAPADLLLLPVDSAVDALARRPAGRTVFIGGRRVCRTEQTVDMQSLSSAD